MSVFHGDWNENPKEFLDLYLQCTAAGGDNFRARQFINYLGVYSDAEDWFDELPQEEKRDWVAIEVSFRKRWLKEEILSIKEKVTTENEPQVPQPTSTLLPASPSASTVTTSTQTDTTTSKQPKINPCAGVATTQSPMPSGNRNSTKKDSTSEISETIIVFSPSTTSVTVYGSPGLSTTTTVLETRSSMPDFTQKHEKHENSSNSSTTTLKPSSPSIIEHINDVTQAHASLHTSNDAVLNPTTLSTGASSLQDLQSTASTGHEKSVFQRAVFKSQVPMESLAPTTIVSALKTRSASTGFAENYQKVEKSPVFAQKVPEPIVLGHSKCADNIDTHPGPTTIIPNLETHSELTGFVKNFQKVKKSPIFAQKAPEPIVSGHSKRADDIYTAQAPTIVILDLATHSETARFTQKQPKTRKSSILGHFDWAINTDSLATPLILPTKHPCDLSSLSSDEFILLILVLNIQLAITHPCFIGYSTISIF